MMFSYYSNLPGDVNGFHIYAEHTVGVSHIYMINVFAVSSIHF